MQQLVFAIMLMIIMFLIKDIIVSIATIVACWKWAQENAPFEPDWDDKEQKKFYVIFDRSEDRITYDYISDYKIQSTLPYFKSKKDCEAFIEANKERLELLFKN